MPRHVSISPVLRPALQCFALREFYAHHSKTRVECVRRENPLVCIVPPPVEADEAQAHSRPEPLRGSLGIAQAGRLCGMKDCVWYMMQRNKIGRMASGPSRIRTVK